ncbi:uncharacterized protein [Solanum tuberosum]|uniref:uncharacterized protein n=1 Tax=Solanum tuberosum TaxID=4113 RepID=UPI00073A331C|nr:PREDICTED: uncharacterized protein LOC102603874 [Solanum tuberosum]
MYISWFIGSGISSRKKGASDSVNEDSTKQVQRKTKWGPDLTQDTTVRKARALAYQRRVDQITQLLSSRSLEGEGSKDSLLASPAKDHESSDHQPTDECEITGTRKTGNHWCVVIDPSSHSLLLFHYQTHNTSYLILFMSMEILKLNPSYKPPAGYKPVPKEAKIPVPVSLTQFSGTLCSFSFFLVPIVLPLGSVSKLTCVLICPQVEVTSGETDSGAYEEMHVQVSAETYEKVDAAVALIELLVTPASMTPAPQPQKRQVMEKLFPLKQHLA